MTDPVKSALVEYEELHIRLKALSPESKEYDNLTDEMDAVWHRMTSEEIDKWHKRSKPEIKVIFDGKAFNYAAEVQTHEPCQYCGGKDAVADLADKLDCPKIINEKQYETLKALSEHGIELLITEDGKLVIKERKT